MEVLIYTESFSKLPTLKRTAYACYYSPAFPKREVIQTHIHNSEPTRPTPSS